MWCWALAGGSLTGTGITLDHPKHPCHAWGQQLGSVTQPLASHCWGILQHCHHPSQTLPEGVRGRTGRAQSPQICPNKCLCWPGMWDQLTAHRVELIGDFQELLVHLEANLLALQDKDKER